ncbi:MAG: ABC transporter transmembrane domain-containing protein, partial [Planctomycetota bacterium]
MKPRSPQLLRIIIKYLGRHRGLVVGILLLGIAQAALLKAPYFLIKDVADLLFEDPAAADTGHANSLFAGFVETKNSILGFLGLTPAIDYPTGDIGLDTRYKRAALIGMSVLLGIMAALGGLTIYAYRVMTSFAATKVIVEMRNDLCGHLLSLSIRFFGRQRTGDLISRVSNDTTTVMRAFNLLFENAVLDPLFLLFNVILASSISPWLGLIVALLIPILSLPMGRFGRKIRRGSGRSLEALGEATDSMEQMFSGFRTVKAFQIEEHEINEFKAVNRRFLRRTMGMLRA